MRVAIIDPSIFTPPYDQALAESLKDAGLEVRWIGRAPRNDDPVSGSAIQPIPLFYSLAERTRNRIPESLWLATKALEHVWQSARLAKYLHKQSFTIAHFQWTPIPLIDRYVIKRIQKNMPTVLTVHDTELFLGSASHGIQTKGWSRLIQSVDQIVVHVADAKEKLLRDGVEERKVHLIRHPAFEAPRQSDLNASLQSYNTESLGYAENRVNCLLFGRLASYKGIDTLLAAVKSMDADERDLIRVVLAGKPALDVRALQLKIESDGISDVVKLIPGFLESEKLIAYLQLSDILLFPYHKIDASGALMQALPYGPAIIASRIGVFAELLENDETAILVQPDDVDSLRRAIIKLSTSEALLTKLHRNTKLLVEGELSWHHAANRTIEVYRHAVESWRSNRRRD